MLFISILFSVFLAFGFGVLQLLLTIGAPFGEYVLGGMHRVLPKKMRILSGFLSIFFSASGLCYLQFTNIVNRMWENDFINIVLIIYTIFLFIAIFSNAFITKSKKEKYVMTPLSIVGFISSIIVLS